ncbi:chromosomal replication initiator protein DnaA [Planctomicrobium piriforme]|uniref:Chromosomal replication initiator protein DnaA n=1 Tax=Planctomicrobium piriforme TaxID=1576369 RepID=A0A1I3QVS9_9PLAN|nr:chromosomal replication initiator protein DnaA [Planctomicrobium piriforme]SFJ37602.1 chromosomal replication initiator protein [Planctomicrobium piriforme]
MPPVLSPVVSFAGPHVSSNALDQLRTALQTHLGPRRFQNWFGASSRLKLDGASLTLCVQSPYLVKWIQKQFEGELLRIAAPIVGPDVTLTYEVGADVSLTPLPEDAETSSAPQPSLSRRTVAGPAPQSVHGRSKRMYSLSEFVVGEANALAMTGVQQFITEPASVSPLYLHGGVGNGKTHLLEGLRARLRKECPQLQVLLLTAEHFCNYFTQALSARTLPSFRTKFRNVDLLLVDDVDFLDGKKGFQEEFLHTLKQFEQEGRSVAVSANRHPRLLSNTSDELVSRFLSGLVCRIESPDDAMRREIVQRRATRLKAKFSTEALDHVANRFTGNVRELEGAVNVLSTWSQMTRSRVTLQVSRKLLGRLERDCVRLIRVGDIETAVCEFFGVETESLRSSSRKQSLSQPRMLAMYLSRKLTQSAYSEIGAHFGGRNHSTVMSAERKIADQLAASQTIRIASETWTLQDLLQTLEDRIKAG